MHPRPVTWDALGVEGRGGWWLGGGVGPCPFPLLLSQALDSLVQYNGGDGGGAMLDMHPPPSKTIPSSTPPLVARVPMQAFF